MIRFLAFCLSFIVALALFAPILSPYNPVLIDLSIANSPPTLTHLFGTDLLGRDLFSRILYSLQTSLIIGVSSAFLSTILALIFIFISQLYFHHFFQRILDLLLAIPSMLVVMLIQSFLSGGMVVMICAIALGHWIFIAKVLDTQLCQLKKLDFYQCSIVLGASKSKALTQDLLPACLNLILILFILNIAHGIGTESTLSFFGLSSDATLPSLGNILNDFPKAIFIGAWWIILFPTLTILALILPLLGLSNALQDSLGVKL